MADAKVGDSVWILSGLNVEEWRVYEIDAAGKPWVRRTKGFGMRAEHYLNRAFPTLEGAMVASKIERERLIRRTARELERLALNTNVKVRLLKTPPRKGTGK